MTDKTIIQQEIDEQIREVKKQFNYETRQYTTEWLVHRFSEGHFYMEPPSRGRGKAQDKSNFLETVFLGLPNPPIDLGDRGDGELIVLGGIDKIRALVECTTNQIKLSGFEMLTKLNIHEFSLANLA